MVQKLINKLNEHRGSATVEAVIAFTGFLLTIFTILGLVNFCRAQMLISSAMDTAAKELSQYAYFYEMSGLQKLEKQLDDKAELGKKDINEIIGTVDSLYASIAGAKDNGGDLAKETANMLSKGDVDMGVYEDALSTLEQDATNIGLAVQAVEGAFSDVGSNPLLYMRSLVSILGSGAAEAAKRAVAVPLARAFTQKHFGDNEEEASKKLESLGVVDGMDGMNFKMSTVFSDKDHQDIALTVYYKVELFQVFDWVVLDANVKKVSVCRAWLGGDAVSVTVAGSGGGLVGETEADEGDSGTKEAPENQSEEETKPEEETQPVTEPVNTDGSYWHKTVDKHGYDEKAAAFDDLLVSSKGIDREPLVVNGLLYGRDKNNTAYGMAYCVDADDVYNNEIYLQSIESIKAQEKEYAQSGGESGYEPGSTKEYVYVIYVPENIPDSELQKIKKAAHEDEQLYTQRIQEKYGETIPVTVEIVKAGGNYDYNTGG